MRLGIESRKIFDRINRITGFFPNPTYPVILSNLFQLCRFRIIGLVVGSCFVSASLADEPMLTYHYDEQGETVQQALSLYSTNKKIDSIKCKLLDFQPHEATVHYMLNFAEPVRVPKIARDGTFWVKGGTGSGGSPPPFLEGMNTLSIISKNRVGLSNRQTIIIQMLTTPIRVDVVWPWVSASIKEAAPVVKADITPIYAGTTLSTSSVDSIKVNGARLDVPLNAISQIPGKEAYRFAMQLPTGLVKSKNPDGTPYENRIQLYITAKVNGSGTSSFSNHWFFLYDITAPTVRLFAPRFVSSAKYSELPVRLRFDDDISPLVRDVRILVKREGTPVCSAFVPWQARGEATIDLPLTRSRSLLWRILLFWKDDEVVLPEGNYTMEVRCRDMALLGPEHVEHENAYQSLSADKNPGWKTVLGTGNFTNLNINAAKKYFNEHFAPTAEPRFNVGEHSISFTIDSASPKISDVSADHPMFTSAFAHQGKDTLLTRFSVNEAAWIDVVYRRKSSDSDTRWVVARRKQFRAIDSNKKDGINAQDIQTDTLDFVSDFHFMPDGVYDLCFTARDSAENELKNKVFSNVFTIDRTGPVITKVISPDFVLDDEKITQGASLSFRAYDVRGRTRVALSDPASVRISKRGSSQTAGTIEIPITKPDSFEYSIPTVAFPKKQTNSGESYERGAYDLVVEARDRYVDENDQDISNRTVERVEFIYGGLPPRITYPLPFSEVTGMIAIKGNATDPDVTNEVPFRCFELAYAPYDPATKRITDALWRADGMTVPEMYGHALSSAKTEMFNTGTQEVSEGKLLGHWDTRDTAIHAGYYALRLIAGEVGDLDLNGNPTGRAYDTVIVRVSKYNAAELNPNPSLTVTAPAAVVDFTSQRFAGINYRLSDPSGRPYKIRVGVRSAGAILRDTVFSPVSSGGFSSGAPRDIKMPGLQLWSENDSWHVRWNDTGSVPCKGVLQGNGRFSISDSGGSQAECTNNDFAEQTDAALLSVLTFDLKPDSEIVFTTTSSKMDLNVLSAHDTIQFVIGQNAQIYSRDALPFQIASGSKISQWKWNGLDVFGTYPPPGHYAAFAIADAEDGMATVAASDSFEIRTPFGVEIDRISSGHFYRSNANPNLLAKPDFITAWYKLRCDARVTAEILDKNGAVVQTVMRDSLQTGRGQKAKQFSVSWNGNRENQLVDGGNRFRFRITAASPNNAKVTVSDTSEFFVAYESSDVRADSGVAKLDVEYEAKIPVSGGTMNLVGGGNDFQWMAKATGKAYPERKIPFKLAISGTQAAATGSFQRHTVKMRRYFDTLNFRVYAFIAGEKKHKRTWSGDNIQGIFQWVIKGKQFTLHEPEGITIAISDSVGPLGQDWWKVHWWWVARANVRVFIVPPHIGFGDTITEASQVQDSINEYQSLIDGIDALTHPDDFISQSTEGDPRQRLSSIDTVIHSFAKARYPGEQWGDGRDTSGKPLINWDAFHGRLGVLRGRLVPVLSAAKVKLNGIESTQGFLDDTTTAIDSLRKVAWREFFIDLGNPTGICDTVNIWTDRNQNQIVDYDSQEVFRDVNHNRKKDGAEIWVTRDTSLINSDINWDANVCFISSDKKRLGYSSGSNGVGLNSSLSIDRGIWSNIYGRNNLVSRYSTWDSENDLYYSKSGGIINQDKFSNDYDSDPDNPMKPWARGDDIAEGERKYSSIRHHQKLKLKGIVDAPSGASYGPPLKFFSLEEHDDLSAVKGEHWQIWLEGHPDAGTYSHFRLAYKKAGQPVKSVTAVLDQDRVDTITIDGPVSDGDILEVWPEGILESNSATWDSVPYPLSWEQYRSLNDWRTEQGGRMFQRLPPGAKRYNEDPRQKTLVPTPSLKLLAKDRARFKTHFDSLGLPCDSIMFVSDTIRDTAVLRYDPVRGYTCDYLIPMALGSHGSIRSVRVMPVFNEPDLVTQYLDAKKEVIDSKKSNAAVVGVRFSLSRQAAWSTDDDPQLRRPGGEVYDEKDNNGNIAVDENASGTLQSGGVQYGDSRGFRLRKRMYFHEGYPCEGQADTNKSLFICECNGDDCSHKGNDRVKVESWKVSVRDIAGRINPDYEVLKVHNDPNSAGGSYFVASLKDDVFFPRRLVPIHGRAFGKSYRIYFRNGSGWDRIAEVTAKDRNDTTGHRLLGFWDVTGLNGRYSLVLEVFDRDNKPVQDEAVVYVGQYADESNGPTVLVGQNGRSRLTLHEKSLPLDPEKHVVTFSAVHLDEIGLSKRPQFNPVGPVISVLPSIPGFPKDKKPKAEIFFTGKECEKNNWLHSNFAFYSINADSGILQPTVSLPTYLFADSANDYAPDSTAIPNPDSFAVLVKSGRDCFMKITGELDHWSNYVVKERVPKRIYVDGLGADSMTASGESWSRAYSTIALAAKAALSGDSILVSAGLYDAGFDVAAGVHLKGGYHGRTRKWDPAQHPTVIQGNGAKAIEAGQGSSIEGIKFEGFAKALHIQTGHVWINRSLFADNGVAVLADGGNLHLTHCTIKSSRTGIELKGSSRIEAINTVFDCASDVLPRMESRMKLAFCRVVRRGSADSLNTDQRPAFKENSLCRLSGASPLIDAGKSLGLAYIDEAPDIGWHEYTGDTIYVNEKLPVGNNDGSSWANALTGPQSLAKAVNAAGGHGRILAAAGEYAAPQTLTRYLVIRGGYDPVGRGTWSPLQNPTRILAPLRVSGFGAAISGVRFENGLSPAIVADSCKVLRMENSFFLNCHSGVGGRARIVEARYCLFNQCQNALDIAADSVAFINNTVVFGVNGLAGSAKACRIENSIFHNLGQTAVANRPARPSCANNCFFETAIPEICRTGITGDPQFVNPAGGNFFLDRNSPCVNAGTNRRHIGAFGPGIRPAKMEILCLRAPSPVKIDGQAGNEWSAFPVTESAKPAPSCGTGSKPGPTVKLSFAYNAEALYGFLNMVTTGKTNCELWLAVARDTLCIPLLGKWNRSGRVVQATAIKTLETGTTSRIEFALSWKKVLKMPPPRDGGEILFNIRMADDTISYLWNGDAGCNLPPASYDRIRFRDEITPQIRINGVKPYNNSVVEPHVEFQYLTPQMRNAVQLNGRGILNNTRIYQEGRHRLKAIVSDPGGKVIVKAETTFVVDFTPPIIEVTDVPPKETRNWIYDRGPVPVAERTVEPVVRVRDSRGIRSARATLNGAPYPLSGILLGRDGQYRLRVDAQDSSGNRSSFETEFTIDRTALRLSVVSPRQGTSTADSQITVRGIVKPAGAKVQVKNTLSYTVTDDTTFEIRSVPLGVGPNSLEVVAYSTLRKKYSAPCTVLVHRDTTAPSIVEFLKPKPYDTIPGSVGEVIEVKFRVRDNLDSASQMHIAIPGAEVKSVRGDTVIADMVLLGESLNYPIQPSLTDRAGNTGTGEMRFIFGTAPVITIRHPAPWSGTRDTTITISGACNDSNTTHVYFDGLPVEHFEPLTDTFAQLVDLRDTINTFLIRAVDAAGFVDVETLVIVVDRVAPVVVLVEPATPRTVFQNTLRVVGRLENDPFATVVLGSDTLRQAGATFSFDYRLKEGENSIFLTAWDSVGNVGLSNTVKVIYLRPDSTIYVDASYMGNDANGKSDRPFPTITAGVQAALSGYTIRIAAGTYRENIQATSPTPRLRYLGADGVKMQPTNSAVPILTLTYGSSVQTIAFEGSGGTGIEANGADIAIQGCSFSLLDKSIHASSGAGLLVTGCTSVGSTTHLDLTGITGGRVTVCDLRGGTNGILMSACSLAVDHNILSNLNTGITLANSPQPGRIAFNTIANCAYAGILLDNSSPRIDQNILFGDNTNMFGLGIVNANPRVERNDIYGQINPYGEDLPGVGNTNFLRISGTDTIQCDSFGNFSRNPQFVDTVQFRLASGSVCKWMSIDSGEIGRWGTGTVAKARVSSSFNWAPVRILPLGFAPVSAHGSSDEVVVLGNGLIRVYDKSGREVRSWAAKASRVRMVQSGKAMTVSSDQACLWDRWGNQTAQFRAPSGWSIVSENGASVLLCNGQEVNRVPAFGPGGSRKGILPSGFEMPDGVSDAGECVVVAKNGKVALATWDGRLLWSVSVEKVERMIALPEIIALLTPSDHRLTLLDRQGAVRTRVGELGAFEGGFHGPCDISTTAEGLLMGSDSGNGRVAVWGPPAKTAKSTGPADDSATTLPLSIRDLRFVPSPYGPAKGPGYFCFRLSGQAEIRVKVFDANGKPVRSLEYGLCPAGMNQLPWNGRNGQGALIVSGPYHYIVYASGAGQSCRTKGKFSVR